MCERLGIKSPKDTEKLKLAKDEVYLKGYYEGVMLVGECKGLKVIIIRRITCDNYINIISFVIIVIIVQNRFVMQSQLLKIP